MKLTKIGYAGGPNPTTHATLQDLIPGRLTPIILVPDEQTLHEVKGLALILNKKAIIEVLEPGKEVPWPIHNYSPWHVNTGRYHLTFDTSDTFQSPHLLFNCL